MDVAILLAMEDPIYSLEVSCLICLDLAIPSTIESGANPGLQCSLQNMRCYSEPIQSLGDILWLTQVVSPRQVVPITALVPWFFVAHSNMGFFLILMYVQIVQYCMPKRIGTRFTGLVSSLVRQHVKGGHS